MLRISCIATICVVLSTVRALSFDYDCVSLLPTGIAKNKAKLPVVSNVVRIQNADGQLVEKFRKNEKIIVEFRFAGDECAITGLVAQMRRPLGVVGVGSWLVTSDKQRTHQCTEEADSLTNVDSETVCFVRAEWLPPTNDYVAKVEIVGTIVTREKMWSLKSILIENADPPPYDKNEEAPVHYDSREYEERRTNRTAGEEEEQPRNWAEEEQETESEANGGEDPNEPEKLDEQEREAANKADRDGEEADRMQEEEGASEKGEENDHDLKREEEMAAEWARKQQQEMDQEDAEGEAVEAEEEKEKTQHEAEIEWEQREKEEQMDKERKAAELRRLEETRDKEEFDRIEAAKVKIIVEDKVEVILPGLGEGKEGEFGNGCGTLSFSFLLATVLLFGTALFI